MKRKKLWCKAEPIGQYGQKVMNFTFGKIYYAEYIGEGIFTVEDDNGVREKFFNLNILFDQRNE